MTIFLIIKIIIVKSKMFILVDGMKKMLIFVILSLCITKKMSLDNWIGEVQNLKCWEGVTVKI